MGWTHGGVTQSRQHANPQVASEAGNMWEEAASLSAKDSGTRPSKRLSSSMASQSLARKPRQIASNGTTWSEPSCSRCVAQYMHWMIYREDDS